MARTVVIGTAGHIDHGKSTLVRALTGTDPDRLAEEKARGITIDLGFAHLDLGDVRMSFVDVPGHERFVKNMLAGVTGIDAVLLVVAADESVMPQTREHFAICRLLRVKTGAIVLTKADLVDDEMLELATLDVRELVAGSFLADAPILPVSSTTGQGLDRLRTVLASLGAGDDAHALSADRPARLPIDRVFSVRGFGTVVTGTLVAGRLSTGDELTLLPSGRVVKVRGLQAHGSRVDVAMPGQRLAVNLAGIEVGDIARGECAVSPGTFGATRLVDVLVEALPDAPPVKHGARVRVHSGTSEVLGRIGLARVEAAGVPEGTPPSVLPASGLAFARLRLEAPIVVTRGDRFIVRAYSPSRTIAGGAVIDPAPPRGPTRTSKGLERFAALDSRQPDALSRAVVQMVTERAGAGLAVEALVTRVGQSPAGAEQVAAQLVATGVVLRVAHLLVAVAAVRALEAQLMRAVGDHHRAQPLSEGLPREEARSRVFERADPLVFAHVVATLVAAGKLTGTERLALASHRVTVSDGDGALVERLRSEIAEGGLLPPDLASIAERAAVSVQKLEQLAALLGRQRVLVKLDTLWFSSEALDALKQEVRGWKGTADGARLDVAAFKKRYGMSRKYAIPLLEYLDRERVTRRMGDARIVL